MHPLLKHASANQAARPAGATLAALTALLALAALLHSQGALAQSYLYVCTVGNHTITGQLPPQECKNSEIRELNPDGTLHKIMPAPRSAEQIRRDQAAEEARLRKEEDERAEARKDRALIETYSNLDEIEAARRRDLAGRQMLIDRAETRIAQYKKERKRLDDEAEFYVNREMPRKLKESFATNQALTEQQEKTRTDSLIEMRRINERYDADRKRFEEIERASRAAEEARRRTAEQNQQ
jgi:hypothetical protein